MNILSLKIPFFFGFCSPTAGFSACCSCDDRGSLHQAGGCRRKVEDTNTLSSKCCNYITSKFKLENRDAVISRGRGNYNGLQVMSVRKLVSFSVFKKFKPEGSRLLFFSCHIVSIWTRLMIVIDLFLEIYKIQRHI